MRLTGEFVAPPEAATARVTTPVTISGFIGPPGATEAFEGHGTAILELRWDPSFGSWNIVHPKYEFHGAN